MEEKRGRMEERKNGRRKETARKKKNFTFLFSWKIIKSKRKKGGKENWKETKEKEWKLASFLLCWRLLYIGYYSSSSKVAVLLIFYDCRLSPCHFT